MTIFSVIYVIFATFLSGLIYFGRYKAFEFEENERRAYFYPKNWQFWVPRTKNAGENDKWPNRYGIYGDDEFRILIITSIVTHIWVLFG